MTCINIAVEIAEIPANWQPPRYHYGQFIIYNNKFCEIIGRKYISPSSAAAKADPQVAGWYYSLYESPNALNPIEISEAEVIAP